MSLKGSWLERSNSSNILKTSFQDPVLSEDLFEDTRKLFLETFFSSSLKITTFWVSKI